VTSDATKSATKYVKTILGQFVKLGHGHFQLFIWEVLNKRPNAGVFSADILRKCELNKENQRI